MSRRRRVFLAFALIVVGMLAVLVIGVSTLTRSDWGRAKLLAYFINQVNRGIQGTLYIGRISGSVFTGLTIDTLEIRDRQDSLFIALARVQLQYDPRDLLDRRIYLRAVRLGRLTANVFEDSVGMFNFRRIFPSGPPGQMQATPRLAFGQFIKVEDVIIDSTAITLSTRWRPDGTVTRAVRDSVTAFNLQRTDKVFWRGSGVIYETKHWRNGHIELDSARLDDRQPGGRKFAVRNLAIDESDPPFKFRNARGFIRILGDSIWPDIAHFELPGSAGSMTGKVWWGNGQPTRFNLAIVGDSVSMEDIAWVYPTLPKTGGGRMQLAIRSERDPRIIDYILTDMDVRSMDSRLRGDMTFAIGAPITILKDVDLSAQPVDFKLIEQLAGEPLPYPWRGTITGSLIASGGPLNDWVVDTSDLIFRDANVPGAVTIGQLRGRMDIVKPSEVVFSGLNVHLDQLDLRTLQFLVPTFPRLNGLVAGRATLDSSWLDVRFRNADLTHTDGSGPATRMVGGGRVTFGETTTTYDIAMNAQPFSFTTFGRAYTETHVPLKGEYVGPVRLQGTTQDLAVTTELRGPAGMIAYDGRVDGDSIGGYAIDGVLTFAGLDLRTLLDTAVTPVTSLNGTTTISVRGDSLLNLAGTVDLALDRSRIDSVRVLQGSLLQLRFADGRVSVSGQDTIQTDAARFIVSGGLGLVGSVRDSLTIDLRASGLDDLQRYLRVSPADTLDGIVNGLLVLRGSIDTLDLGGVLTGRDLILPGVRAQRFTLTPAFRNVTNSIAGSLDLVADTVSLAGMRFRDINGSVHLSDGKTGDYSVIAVEINGPVIASGGAITMTADTTTVRMDSLSVRLDDKRFTLQRPAAIRVAKDAVVVDTVILAADGASATFAANVPDSLPLMVRLAVQALPLRDVSQVAQTRVPLGGDLTATLDVTGTRESPRMEATATLKAVTAGDVKVAQIQMVGSYADRRVRGEGRVVQADTTVLELDGNYPIDLALVSRDARLLDDTMRVRVRSPKVGLAILESFTAAVRAASGSFSLNAELAGRGRNAVLNGALRIDSGRATLPRMGITLRGANANIVAENDIVRIETLTMLSGALNRNRFGATGTISHPLNPDSVSFDLTMEAREFHAIGLARTMADLYITADVNWKGTDDASVATGTVLVDRGEIALPEVSDKDLFSKYDPTELGVGEAQAIRLGLMPRPMTRFLAGLSAENVRLNMGSDVWLRSQDANIKLTGGVNLTVSSDSVFSEDQLALTGDLQTERGTYRLNVSPVQRTFQVESGTLRFDGTPGFNPALDIRAVYTSRVVNSTYGGRNDVRIGVQITGTLANPSPFLYAADSLFGLSQSDLLSYVLFDQPSFSVGSPTSSLERLVLQTVSSFASSRATQFAGGFVDVVQLQTGQYEGTQNYGLGLFEGAQLAIGKQVTDRAFVSLTSGLCRVFLANDYWSSLGAKAEYRFGRNSQSGISFTYEPKFDTLLCSTGADRFSTSKRQVGFDFFRTWRR